jgi:hypothetical protein
MMFVGLEPWEERKSPSLHAKALVAGWNRKFAAIPGAMVFHGAHNKHELMFARISG